VPYGIDFEDFHSGEHGGPGSDLPNALGARVERHVIPGAQFITAGSPMIAEMYAERYGVRPLAIHNTFSRVPDSTAASSAGPLRLTTWSGSRSLTTPGSPVRNRTPSIVNCA